MSFAAVPAVVHAEEVLTIDEYCFYTENNDGALVYTTEGDIGRPPSLAVYSKCDREQRELIVRVP